MCVICSAVVDKGLLSKCLGYAALLPYVHSYMCLLTGRSFSTHCAISELVFKAELRSSLAHAILARERLQSKGCSRQSGTHHGEGRNALVLLHETTSSAVVQQAGLQSKQHGKDSKAASCG